MIPVFNDTIELVNKIRDYNIFKNPSIIGIDGASGSGKTTLSYCLGCNLRVPVLNVDIFLRKKRNAFIDEIKYSDLYDNIEFNIRDRKLTTIIEGVCLLKIFEKLNLKYSKFIYVKYVDNFNIWKDEYKFYFDDNLNNHLIKYSFDLDKEIITYHYNYNPDKKADFIFNRRENL